MAPPNLEQQATEAFAARFGAEPANIVKAPGRVNLIGEHTDYNDGHVLPTAIDQGVWIALRPRAGEITKVYAVDFEQEAQFHLGGLLLTRSPSATQKPGVWPEYIKGVAWALQREGHALQGWEGVVGGNLPAGAGLGSSASLELAAARAFAVVSKLPWEPLRMARTCQRAENEWVGMRCGIMDQIVCALGVDNNALLIDCRSLDIQSLQLPAGAGILVLDTTTRRGLTHSAYNERRAQCFRAAQYFGLPALRDVSLDLLDSRAAGMDEITRQRARHVVTEMARTLEAADAMRCGDAVRLGKLMNASHQSLRDDFEVSTPKLDTMVECARRQEGCYGARLTGAGFGGCAVALVASDRADEIAKAAASCYSAATGVVPKVYRCTPAAGACVVK